VSQSRAVFERRRAHNGLVNKVVLHEVSNGPLIERPDEVARLMQEHIAVASQAR